MSKGWENYDPAPLEFFHSELLKAFHSLRQSKGDNPEKTLTLNGIEFSHMVAEVKMATYSKYPDHVSHKVIPKGPVKDTIAVQLSRTIELARELKIDTVILADGTAVDISQCGK